MVRYIVPATTIDGPAREPGEVVEIALHGRLEAGASGGPLELHVTDFAGPNRTGAADHVNAAVLRSVIALNQLTREVFARAAHGDPDAEQAIARTVLATVFTEEVRHAA